MWVWGRDGPTDSGEAVMGDATPAPANEEYSWGGVLVCCAGMPAGVGSGRGVLCAAGSGGGVFVYCSLAAGSGLGAALRNQ